MDCPTVRPAVLASLDLSPSRDVGTMTPPTRPLDRTVGDFVKGVWRVFGWRLYVLFVVTGIVSYAIRPRPLLLVLIIINALAAYWHWYQAHKDRP